MIENSPWDNFESAIKSPATLKLYTGQLWRFVVFASSQDPEFDSCSGESVPGKLLRFAGREKWVEIILMRYLKQLKDRVDRGEISGATVNNELSGLKLFLSMNDVVGINWEKLSRFKPAARTFGTDRAPTLEELHQLLNGADLRLRAAIMIMASGGLRVGAWDYLKVGHFVPFTKGEELLCAKIVVYSSTADEYLTFITPEAYRAFSDYLAFRTSHGEEISNESPALRNAFRTSDLRKAGLGRSPKPYSSNNLAHELQRLMWIRRIRTQVQRRHEWKASHGFRKFFKTRAEGANMKSIDVETLMGHRIGVSNSYYKPTETYLREEYLKVVPVLTISGPQIGNDSALEKLREEFDARIDALQKEMRELSSSGPRAP